MIGTVFGVTMAVLFAKPHIGITIERLKAEHADLPPVATIRTSVMKAMPPLWEGMEEHNQKRNCFTCHNHGVSLVAMATAKRHGYDVPKEKIKEQIVYIVEEYDRYRERFKKGQGPGPSPSGGETDNTGYAMLALHAVGYQPNELTELVVSYTLSNQKGRPQWVTPALRFPSESSALTVTALNVAALSNYSTESQKEKVKERIDAARSWLVTAKTVDTEDRVFRLLGLRFANADERDIAMAARELAVTQRPDGGWAQTDKLTSDAYATGSALYALRTAGRVDVSDLRWRRGLAWIIANQKADGTWHVKTRSRPIQKYYESGFPHEKDQFISCAASAWAMAALALATPQPPK